MKRTILLLNTSKIPYLGIPFVIHKIYFSYQIYLQILSIKKKKLTKMDSNEEVNNFVPRTLVLGSFWIKSLGPLGFLIPLQEDGYLDTIDTYCGVSTGALISLLLIIECDVRDIINVIIELDILGNVSNLLNLVSKNGLQLLSQKGIIDINKFKDKLKLIIVKKVGYIPTLEVLRNIYGKSLIIHCLNTKTNNIEIINSVTDPNLSCVDAVSHAINIPFIFKQLENTNLIDSYFSNSYPIDFYDNDVDQILGINMKHTKERADLNLNLISSNNIKDMTLYFYKLIISTLEQKQNENFQKCSTKCRSVQIPVKISDPIGYNLDIDDKSQLLLDGYMLGLKYLNNDLTSFKINNKSYKYTYPEYILVEDEE